MWIKWKLVSVHLEIWLIFKQDKCMFCAERSIGSEIILDTPDVTPRDMGLVECHSGPFRHVVSVGAR